MNRLIAVFERGTILVRPTYADIANFRSSARHWSWISYFSEGYPFPDRLYRLTSVKRSLPNRMDFFPCATKTLDGTLDIVFPVTLSWLMVLPLIFISIRRRVSIPSGMFTPVEDPA